MPLEGKGRVRDNSGTGSQRHQAKLDGLGLWERASCSLNVLPCTCHSAISPGSFRDSKIKSVREPREPRAFISEGKRGRGGEAMRQKSDTCQQLVSEVNHSLHKRLHAHTTHTHALTSQTLQHTHSPTQAGTRLKKEMKQTHQPMCNCSARALVFQTEAL